MAQIRELNYASNQTQVTRHAGRLVVTVPSKRTAGYLLWCVAMTAVIAILIASAVRPTPFGRAGSASSRRLGSPGGRVTSVLLAAAVGLILCDGVRKRSRPAKFVVGDGHLETDVPTLWGTFRGSHPLTEIARVETIRQRKGKSVNLVLLSRGGANRTMLLNGFHYHPSDLAAAAEALSAEMNPATARDASRQN